MKSLVCEWVCGRIGQALGLPIPLFDFLYAQGAVAAYSANNEIEALAVAPGFASRYVGTRRGDSIVALPTLNPADAPEISETLRRRVLLFDWWIRNHDRTDDNPNLLWDPSGGTLHVIDHNLAFDEDPPEEFWARHIFRDCPMKLDGPEREADLLVMRAILDSLPSIWAELPEPWTEASALTLVRANETLRRCLTDDFWCPR